MMDFQRTLLLVALAFTLMMIYQRWIEENNPPQIVQTQPASGEVAPAAPQTVGADTPRAPEAISAPALPPVAAAPAGRKLIVETDLLRAEINTQGGDIVRLELLKYPVKVEKPDTPFVLLTEDAADLFLAQTGLIGSSDRQYPTHKALYQAEQDHYRLAPGQETLTVPLTWTAPDGVRYLKTLSFSRNRYDVRVDYEVDNRTAAPWSGFAYTQFVRTAPPKASGLAVFTMLPTYLGGAIYTPEERFDKIDFSEMEDSDLNREAEGGWVAMLQHYFVGAFFPGEAGKQRFYSRVAKDAAGVRYTIGSHGLQPVMAAPGAHATLKTTLYAGPKEQERLKEQAEGFLLTVDFGWLTPVAAPLFWVLKFLHSVVRNWGWAIILLTVLIKLAFFPLSAASYKSMAKMKNLQPRLQTLKERFGDDRAKLNQAMMELYKTEKINPMGGCLPILIQIPVFIALYWVLLESVELRQAPFALWWKDLSSPDPYFVLPLLMGATMFLQTWLNPSPLDPIQQKVMLAMPVMFTVFFLWFPAGLVLYWLVNNVLSIAQQWYITNKLAPKKA
jgi:YidC/Oxa1 family membrane protein insertase